MEAWWVTGERESFFFFYLHKPGGAHKSAGPHTPVCLAKVAGDLGATQSSSTRAAPRQHLRPLTPPSGQAERAHGSLMCLRQRLLARGEVLEGKGVGAI